MMKKILILMVLVFYYACSDGDNTIVLDSSEKPKDPTEIKEPVANNDNYNTFKNTDIIISTLLDNDENADNVEIEIISTGLKGTIDKNVDESYTYKPSTDFTGEDTFKYTICSISDSERCSTATVTISIVDAGNFVIPSELVNYYSSVTFSNNSANLLEELEDISTEKHTNILTYGQRHNYLYSIDEDPTNTANVILMYTSESRDEREWTSDSNPHSTQTFNTEHVYPQSLYNGGDVVRADLHHLRVCDASVNSTRSNRKFVEGSGAAKITGSGWYPGDEWKGDVARMILYLNVRYDESISTVGDLNTFLKWNKEDPISAFEEQRNDRIEGAQGNRNPFIDNPYLATIIWGGGPAENKWD